MERAGVAVWFKWGWDGGGRGLRTPYVVHGGPRRTSFLAPRRASNGHLEFSSCLNQDFQGFCEFSGWLAIGRVLGNISRRMPGLSAKRLEGPHMEPCEAGAVQGWLGPRGKLNSASNYSTVFSFCSFWCPLNVKKLKPVARGDETRHGSKGETIAAGRQFGLSGPGAGSRRGEACRRPGGCRSESAGPPDGGAVHISSCVLKRGLAAHMRGGPTAVSATVRGGRGAQPHADGELQRFWY